MLIVSDSSPLNALIRSGYGALLGQLFDRVTIPSVVAQELQHPNTPDAVREFIQSPPSWLTISDPKSTEVIRPLHGGESAAIWLALELPGDLLLIDESDGRRIAQKMGIKVIGTLGILELAAARKLLDLRTSINNLPPDFRGRLAPQLIEDVIARNREQRPED